MRQIFIFLCKKSPDRYYFNLLRITALVYHMCIEYDIYNLAYLKTGYLYESQFIEGSMGK